MKNAPTNWVEQVLIQYSSDYLVAVENVISINIFTSEKRDEMQNGSVGTDKLARFYAVHYLPHSNFGGLVIIDVQSICGPQNPDKFAIPIDYAHWVLIRIQT